MVLRLLSSWLLGLCLAGLPIACRTAPAACEHPAHPTRASVNDSSGDVTAAESDPPSGSAYFLPVQLSADAAPAIPAGSDWTAASREPFSLREDLRNAPGRGWDDVRGLANWNNAAILGVSLGGSLLIRSQWDDNVRDSTAAHPERWGTGSDVLRVFGEAYVQWPIVLGAYGWSLRTEDEALHDVTATSISALGLSGVSTLLVKGIANTDRPSSGTSGGQFGFPSYHAASSFALAAVMDEYYGPQVGLPAYVFAGLIGWSRIDRRDHDLSDVVFGAAMGYVIGKSVAGTHLYGDGRVRIRPWSDPLNGASGAAVETRF